MAHYPLGDRRGSNAPRAEVHTLRPKLYHAEVVLIFAALYCLVEQAGVFFADRLVFARFTSEDTSETAQ